MLRVAMVTDHAASSDKVDGGVQAVTKYLVDAFVKRGDLNVHVIGFNYNIKKGRSTTVSGYTLHTLPGATGGALTGYWKDQQTLDSLLSSIQPDIVHGQGAGQNGIVAIRSSFPSVITIHGIMAEEAKYYSGLLKRTRHRLLGKWSEHYCIKGGRHTILISPYVAQHFDNRLAGMQYMIPNPIADEFFDINRSDDSNRVLFAGRLYALKGIIDLIRAAAKVAKNHKIELILAGSLNDKQYVAQLKQEAARLGISDLVQFKGLLGERELRAELGRSAVLVLPSYQETAPLVIAEAMAAGVPVVATMVGGVPHQVRDDETGYIIEPGDTESLSQRIYSLLSDRSLRQLFGRTARKLASNEYRAENVAERTIAIYKQITANEHLV